MCNARHQGRSRFREHQPFDRRSSERAECRTLTRALRLSLVHLDYKPTWASIPARNINTAENRAPLNFVLLSDQRSVGSNFGSYPRSHTSCAIQYHESIQRTRCTVWKPICALHCRLGSEIEFWHCSRDVRPLQRFLKVRLRDSKDRGCTVRLARPRALRTYLWQPVMPDALTALWRTKRISLQMQINSLESRPTCALYERAMRKHIRFMYASRATPDYVRRLGFETHIAKKDISSTVYFATLGKCCEGHRKGP
jgi:hypothetical protein